MRRGDPDAVRQVAVVDTDDLDAVTDVFIDRVVDRQVEERLPVMVVLD